MLSTVAKLKLHLGIPAVNTAKDDLLATLLEGASAFIETSCNRKFGFAEYDDIFTKTETTELYVKNIPIVEIGEIKVGTNILDHETLIADDNLILDKKSGLLFYPTGFVANVVRVNYTAGYVLPGDESGVGGESGLVVEDLPVDIELAAIRLAARVYERRTAEGLASASPGSFSANYAQEMDTEIKQTLAHHRISP